MTADRIAESNAKEVPLTELLLRVPKEHCISVPSQWDEGGRETGHHHIPVGSLMHRAAASIAAAEARIKEMTEIGIEIQDERLARYEQAARDVRQDIPNATKFRTSLGRWAVYDTDYDKLRAAAVALKADLKFEEDEATHFEALFEKTAAALAAKEQDRQYHMNELNRLAKSIGWLGASSNEVVSVAINKIATARQQAIEECAKVCDRHAKDVPVGFTVAIQCARLIRALAKKEST